MNNNVDINKKWTTDFNNLQIQMSKYINYLSPVDEEEYVTEIVTMQEKVVELKKAVVEKILGEYNPPLQPEVTERLTIVTSFAEFADLTEEEMRIMTAFEVEKKDIAPKSLDTKVRDLFFPGNPRSLTNMCNSKGCSLADFYRKSHFCS